MAACVSRVELSVSCRSLLDKGPGLQVRPLCVLLQDAGGGRWAELDCTEKIKNCQDPEFGKKLVVDYYFEKVQKLKFCVYDIDNKSFDLNDDDFLGGIECTLGQISAEEIKGTRVVYLEIEAQNLDKKVIKNNLNRCWRKFSVLLQTFYGGDFNKPIKVQCADHDSDGSHDLIGTLETTLVKMQTSGAGSLVEYESIHLEKKQKKNNYKNSGIIMIKSARDPRNSGCLLPDSASDPTLRANQLLSYYKPHGKVCSTLTATRNCLQLKPSYFNEEPVSNQQYFILLIITDGEITDLDQTRQVIVNASKLPMSIIIIGVGEASFKAMEFLGGDSSVLKSVTGSSGSTFPDGLAEVPKQLVSYYKWQGCPPSNCQKSR